MQSITQGPVRGLITDLDAMETPPRQDNGVSALVRVQETPLRSVAMRPPNLTGITQNFFGNFGWPGRDIHLLAADYKQLPIMGVMQRINEESSTQNRVFSGITREDMDALLRKWQASVSAEQRDWNEKVGHVLRNFYLGMESRMGTTTETFNQSKLSLDFVWENSMRNIQEVQSQLARLGASTSSFVEGVYSTNNARIKISISSLESAITKLQTGQMLENACKCIGSVGGGACCSLHGY